MDIAGSLTVSFRVANKIATAPMLGSKNVSLGCGSNACLHADEVDAILQSHDDQNTIRRGAMLSHLCCRSFLKHIHSDDLVEEEEEAGFGKAYKLIRKETAYGIVRKKNDDGKTPEPNATSLLGALANHVIARPTATNSSSETVPTFWVLEYESYRTSKRE